MGPVRSPTSPNGLKITARLQRASEELAKERKVLVPRNSTSRWVKFVMRLLQASEEHVNACCLVPHN